MKFINFSCELKQRPHTALTQIKQKNNPVWAKAQTHKSRRYTAKIYLKENIFYSFD